MTFPSYFKGGKKISTRILWGKYCFTKAQVNGRKTYPFQSRVEGKCNFPAWPAQCPEAGGGEACKCSS